MNCCQCQGIEELFDEQYVNKELARYRSKGPDKTTRMLMDMLREEGVEGLTLLDIGGGVGAIQHGLLDAGVRTATNVEASSAYLAAAQAEAEQRGIADRVSHLQGNFVDLAATIPPADIVTLDRVICCYPDVDNLVSLSVARTRKLYGLVYPREAWWIRIGLGIENLFYRLRSSSFQVFIHPTEAVQAVLSRHGFKRRSYRQTLIWQVTVYAR